MINCGGFKAEYVGVCSGIEIMLGLRVDWVKGNHPWAGLWAGIVLLQNAHLTLQIGLW